MKNVRVCGPKARAPKGAVVVNTTSHSDNWSKGLSPFFLGPVPLYDGMVAKNVENAWQYSKLYAENADADGNPTEKHWAWAKAGFANNRAVRYPMGKGAKPLCSLWKGEKLGYIEARKRVYVPLYAGAVKKADAYQRLVEVCKRHEACGEEVWLWDFDGYDHVAMGMSLSDVASNEARPMGHAFVLAALLQNEA